MMNTRILSLSPADPDPATLAAAAEILRAGGLVAFPTETVYGLGANALNSAAVARIFNAKGRPSNNPIIVHVADEADLFNIVAEWPDAARKLAARLWPGPLTLVLPRSAEVPDIVTAGGVTVAVRMPAHSVARALIRAAGVPIAAPSANRSGELSPTCAEHVVRGLSGRIEMILDGGPTQVGIESTVLDLSTTPPRLLRPGHISPAEIEAIIGPIARPETRAVDNLTALPSPGMLAKHYAPHTPTECCVRSAERVRELMQRGETVGWLTFKPSGEAAVIALMPRDASEYAARLYAELHRLDGLGLSRIVVEMPPETDGWLAVCDRLRRATARD